MIPLHTRRRRRRRDGGVVVVAPACAPADARGAAFRACPSQVEDEHEVWWECPASPVGRLLFALTLPLKAAVHLTTYDVKAPAYVDYYPAALAASLGWLVVLAMLMTSCLDAIGCIIDFSDGFRYYLIFGRPYPAFRKGLARINNFSTGRFL